jgi:hypothetical protein
LRTSARTISCLALASSQFKAAQSMSQRGKSIANELHARSVLASAIEHPVGGTSCAVAFRRMARALRKRGIQDSAALYSACRFS